MARTSLQATLDVADSTVRTVISALTMSHCSWFQSLGLPHKVQQSVQELPFQGTSLFSKEMDSNLHGFNDLRATLAHWAFTCLLLPESILGPSSLPVHGISPAGTLQKEG